MSEGKTTGDIIRPPAFHENAARERRERAEERKRAEDQRRHELHRLREIEKAPGHGKKGPVFGLGDKLFAALANGGLIEQARREGGVSIQAIEERFGGRSDRYRLAPGTDIATREAKEKAGRRLMQQVRGYLRLAKAVADLTGENADDLKLDVLRGTSLWSSPTRSRGEDAGDERAERLALLIHEMAKHVIREARLADLFEKLRRVPAEWHGWGTDSREFSSHFYASLKQGGYENSSSFSPPPFPSVRLARLPAAALSVSVFSGERKEVDASDGFRGTLWLSRELRLVIGPTTSTARPGPMFESRPYVDLLADDGPDEQRSVYICSQNPHEHLSFGTKDQCFAELSARWSKYSEGAEGNDELWANVLLRRKADGGGTPPMFRLKAMGRVRLIDDVCDPEWSDPDNFMRLYWRRIPGTPAPRRERRPPLWQPQWEEHWENVAWKPVDAFHVSCLLDGTSPFSHALFEPPHDEYDEDGGDYDELAESECWFSSMGLPHNVEHRLVTGDLERALLATSEHIRRALDRHVREWRDRLEERDARLIAEWSAGADEET